MKKAILLSFIALTLLFSCKKEKEISVDEVTYEVTLVNSTTWHGSYLNKSAQIIGITNAPTNWKHTFKNTNNLVVAQLDAYSDGLGVGADAYMKIYVNGTVVASGQSSISPRVMYIFPY